MKISDIDRNKLAPMMRHYVELKDNYQDVILLYRLGDFYEMFFEDAVTVSHELELTLTGRAAGLEERVPMCGVPAHSVDVYIDKLIAKGFKVAICEQLSDAKNSKGMVKRDVTEVISSGTIVSAGSLNEKENNFIGNVYDFDYLYVLSYADITTGEYYIEKIEALNFIDVKFAVCLKEIANEMQELHPEVQIWVDNEPNVIKQIGMFSRVL